MNPRTPDDVARRFTTVLRRYWSSVVACWVLLAAVGLAVGVRAELGAATPDAVAAVLAAGLAVDLVVGCQAFVWLFAFPCPRCGRRFTWRGGGDFWPTRTCKHCGLRIA